jgi:hypothetical protein
MAGALTRRIAPDDVVTLLTLVNSKSRGKWDEGP